MADKNSKKKSAQKKQAVKNQPTSNNYEARSKRRQQILFGALSIFIILAWVIGSIAR